MAIYTDRFSDKELDELEEFARNFKSGAYMVIKRVVDSHIENFAWEAMTDDDRREWINDLNALLRIHNISRQKI